MPYMTTKAAGMTFAFPNVCLTPPLAIPIPYPSIGDCANGNSATLSMVVYAVGMQAYHLRSEVLMTTGDEPGVLLGVVSGTRGNIVRRIQPSVKVFIEGNPAVFDTGVIGSNGPSFNIVGAQVSPSQMVVTING